MAVKATGLQSFRYDGKRVIVTGCASGIGHATAALLLGLGADVHGLDLKLSDLGLASFNTVDLAAPDSIDAALGQIGSVDALFNCAGLPPTHPPLNIFKVNFLGTRYLTERVTLSMPSGGAVVSTASNGGAQWRYHLPELLDLLGHTTFAAGQSYLQDRLQDIGNAYAYAKEALIVWTLQQSAILIKRGIRINCSSPGAVQTPMLDEIEIKVPRAVINQVAQPIGRRSSAPEQAWPLVWLNSDAASYINGADLPVDGGFAASLQIGAGR